MHKTNKKHQDTRDVDMIQVLSVLINHIARLMYFNYTFHKYHIVTYANLEFIVVVCDMEGFMLCYCSCGVLFCLYNVESKERFGERSNALSDLQFSL